MRWCCVLALTACLGGARPLSDLHGTHAVVSAADTLVEYPTPQQFPPSLSVLLETPDCSPLADDATASFAGIPLVFARDSHDGGCLGWGASLDNLAVGAFDGKATTIVIRDSSETWKIDVPGLHDSAIAVTSPLVAGGAAQVAWLGGPLIWAGRLHLDMGSATFDVISTTTGGWQFPTRAGDPATVTIPAVSGPTRASIELDGTAIDAAMCQGPAACEIDESVAAAFDLTIAP